MQGCYFVVFTPIYDFFSQDAWTGVFFFFLVQTFDTSETVGPEDTWFVFQEAALQNGLGCRVGASGRPPGFKSWLSHLLNMGPQAIYVICAPKLPHL